MSSVKKTLLI
ncbi:hypothetical protein B4U80_06665 [Leptotrombidium deliense]|uniref:Uncharacterized protein n=1 Tax=Leptotrombidium deliense TaxID=299467 RepID=A0A443S3X0_9ACAR|nr:hypothetical protein B4U80_06665 [Leptotrombidium deliense]